MYSVRFVFHRPEAQQRLKYAQVQISIEYNLNFQIN